MKYLTWLALLIALWAVPALAVEGESVNVLTPIELTALQVFSSLIDHDQIDPYALNDLSDATITTPADNAFLRYDNGTGQWIDETVAIPVNLDDLADVDLTGLSDGDSIAYELATTTWKPSAAGANYWSRAGTTLSPATANDDVQLTGDSRLLIENAQTGTGDYGAYFHMDGGAGATIGLALVNDSADNAAYELDAGRILLNGWADFAEQGGAPADPATGKGRLYAANDGTLHFVNDGSTDYDLTAGGASTLAGLSDVSISSPALNEFLRYNGTKWANAAVTIPPDLSAEPFITGNTSANLSAEAVLTAGPGVTLTPAAGTLTVSSTAPWTLVPKTADEALQNDNTLNNDSALSFAYSSGYYAFSLRVYFTATAAGDFQYATAWSANLSRTNYAYGHIVPGVLAGTANLTTGDLTASGTAVTVVGTGTTGGYVQIEGAFQASGAGTFNFKWAQNSLDNNPGLVVHAGSWLQYRKVS